jgi:hypothetical protein
MADANGSSIGDDVVRPMSKIARGNNRAIYLNLKFIIIIPQELTKIYSCRIFINFSTLRLSNIDLGLEGEDYFKFKYFI